MPRPEKKRKVLKAFYESESDLAPEEVANKAGTSRRTAKKWIEKLEVEGEIIKTREIGRTSLYKLAPPAKRDSKSSRSRGIKNETYS